MDSGRVNPLLSSLIDSSEPVFSALANSSTWSRPQARCLRFSS